VNGGVGKRQRKAMVAGREVPRHRQVKEAVVAENLQRGSAMTRHVGRRAAAQVL
jgi:hypothetical protein